MALSNYWRDFIQNYRADRHFQYFPHAHVGGDAFPAMVRVLGAFEGQAWNDVAVMTALRQAHLTTGHGAGGRMLRKATENLGLCWFDNHVLWITPAGRALIEGANKTAILERLLWRYQLSNPINDGALGFDIYPHHALLRTLTQTGNRITRDEFILFVGRVRNGNGIDDAVERILSWRTLSDVDQDEVIALCGREFSRRKTDTSYVLGFHACASYLDRFNDQRGRRGVVLLNHRTAEIRERIQFYENYDLIDFSSKSDCVAFYGDFDQIPDVDDAVDYYLDTSQYEKAVAAFAKLPISARKGKTVDQFQEEVFLERDLEDYLENHLDLIEPGLHFDHRQYGTEAGTIDIIATAANGDRVVIELKKVRASDKVFGQICRYMGCIAAHHAPAGQLVRGFIVGSEIDQKLRYAASVVPDGKIGLKWFRRQAGAPEIFIEG